MRQQIFHFSLFTFHFLFVPLNCVRKFSKSVASHSPVRKNQKKFGFSLTYSYLCTRFILIR